MKKLFDRYFTLIELLVVIAIIAILMTMLLPALRRVKDVTKEVSCFNNMKQSYLAIDYYASDYDGYPPLSRSPDHLYPNHNFVNAHWIALYLGLKCQPLPAVEKTKEYDVLICPSEKEIGQFVYSPKAEQTARNDPRGKMYFSYGTNHYLTMTYGTTSCYWTKLHKIKKTAKTFLVGEPKHAVYDPPFSAPYRLYQGSVMRNDNPEATYSPELRHKNVTSTNVIFYDGHSEPSNLNKLIYSVTKNDLPWDYNRDGK